MPGDTRVNPTPPHCMAPSEFSRSPRARAGRMPSGPAPATRSTGTCSRPTSFGSATQAGRRPRCRHHTDLGQYPSPGPVDRRGNTGTSRPSRPSSGGAAILSSATFRGRSRPGSTSSRRGRMRSGSCGLQQGSARRGGGGGVGGGSTFPGPAETPDRYVSYMY
jgi:hypothetical protein